ncbi:MAG TPA: hypothetical protein VGN88_13870 [Phycisphaerae bacterium]
MTDDRVSTNGTARRTLRRASLGMDFWGGTTQVFSFGRIVVVENKT